MFLPLITFFIEEQLCILIQTNLPACGGPVESSRQKRSYTNKIIKNKDEIGTKSKKGN